jgi:HEAT repeat protein
MKRRKKVFLALFAVAVVAAGAAGLSLWDLKHRSGLPPLVRERMPAYWRTSFIGSDDVRQRVRRLYDAEAQHRWLAAGELRNMGPRAAAATPYLAAMLADGPVILRVDNNDISNPMLIADGRPMPDQPVITNPQPQSISERVLAFLIGPPRTPEIARDQSAWLTASDALADIGPPAADLLLEALADPLPAVRAQAARALGNAGDPRAIEPLARLLADPRPEVRPYAAQALGQFDNPQAVGFLAVIAAHPAQPTRVRWWSACGLLDRGDAEMAVLLRLLGSDSAEDRRIAACAMARRFVEKNDEPGEYGFVAVALKDPPHDAAVIDALVTASRDTDTVTAAMAVATLRPYRDERVVPALIEALKHPAAGVRTVAINGLLAHGDARAAEPLVAALGKEKGPAETAYLEAHAAAQLGGRAVTLSLAALLDARSDGARNTAILMALNELKDPASADALAAADVRKINAWNYNDQPAVILARLGDLRCVETLKYRTAEDSDASYANALAGLGADGVGPLVEAAEHPVSNLGTTAASIRNIIGYALATVRDPKAVDALLAVAADAKGHVPLRLGAIEALGRIGDKRAADPLVGLAADEKFRSAAFVALARLGDGRAYEPLLEQLNSPKADEVRDAITGLGCLKDPRAADPICKTLSERCLWKPLDWDRWVNTEAQGAGIRAAAAKALCLMGDDRGAELWVDGQREFDRIDWPSERTGTHSYLSQVDPAPLIQALGDSNHIVQREVAEALIQTAGPRAYPALLAAFPKFDWWNRCFILNNTMKEAADPAAVDLLCDLATADPASEVRETAIGFLARRGGEKVVATLRRAADGDECRSVRIAAWRALERLTGEHRPAGLPHRWAAEPSDHIPDDY